MDSTKFDLFVRHLASGMTRREAVRRLVVGGAAAASGGMAIGTAKAKQPHHHHHGGNGGNGGNGGGGNGGGGGGNHGHNTGGGDGGDPGTCVAGADACASITGAVCTCQNGSQTGLCRARLGGGTVCAIDITKPAMTACDQCRFDDDCIRLGFPSGSSCVQDFGPNCTLCGDGGLGTCVAPCGFVEPA